MTLLLRFTPYCLFAENVILTLFIITLNEKKKKMICWVNIAPLSPACWVDNAITHRIKKVDSLHFVYLNNIFEDIFMEICGSGFGEGS